MPLSPLALTFEFLSLFVVLPLAIRFSPWPLPVLPLLWAATGYCLMVLWRDPRFARAQLWDAAAGKPALASVLFLFLLLGSLITLAVAVFRPALLFGLVRQRPILWALIMLLYPILSVYPQGLVYRAFLMQRSAPLLRIVTANPDTQRVCLVVLSAAAFGFMHLIFRNPLAPALTFLGGLLFAWRYSTTGSLAVSSLEHALYGCLLFTVGLGAYFYHGRTFVR